MTYCIAKNVRKQRHNGQLDPLVGNSQASSAIAGANWHPAIPILSPLCWVLTAGGWISGFQRLSDNASGIFRYISFWQTLLLFIQASFIIMFNPRHSGLTPNVTRILFSHQKSASFCGFSLSFLRFGVILCLLLFVPQSRDSAFAFHLLLDSATPTVPPVVVWLASCSFRWPPLCYSWTLSVAIPACRVCNLWDR